MAYLALTAVLSSTAALCDAGGDNWYAHSFYLLHEDHHTFGTWEVGRDADPEETGRLIALSKPDVIQIHAKGNPGWTTYPTRIGHTPPKLARDVLAVWRDIARRDGYRFSVYYNIGRDGEIMRRRPEWNRVKADGTPYERSLCYHSGVAEEYLWPMIREIMQGYAPDGFWFDGSCFTVWVCYCAKCRERFQREQGLAAPESPKAAGWEAYKEMQRQIYREFVHGTVAMIHGLNPDCLVAFNWAYSLRMPERPDAGMAYVTGDIGNGVDRLAPEAHWYDALGIPFDLMTQIKTRMGNAMRPKPRGQIEQEMAVIVANGGRYFAWDNPTPQTKLTPEGMEFLGEVVAPFLRERQRWCLGSERVPDVSLLHHAAAHYAVTDASHVCFSPNDNRISGACRALSRLHLNYEMLPDWRLQAQEVKSKLLIVEHPKVLAPEAIESLIRFVRSGGSVLMTGMALTGDPRLRELLGIADVVGPAGSEQLTAQAGGEAFQFTHWLSRLKLSTATRLLGVRDANGDTDSLLTRNRVGEGAALYVPLPLLSEHGDDVVPLGLLRHLMETALPSVQRHVSTDAPETVEVVLRRMPGEYVLHLVNLAPGKREVTPTDLQTFTTITDIPPVPPVRVTVRLPARPMAVTLQPQNRALENWVFEGGHLRATVPGFPIHQLAVMQVPD